MLYAVMNATGPIPLTNETLRQWMPAIESKLAIGRVVKAWREERGIALTELAKRANTAQGNLSRIEEGTGNPTIETLVKLCHVLNIQPIDLFNQTIPHP
jgi:DNA-binding XRE family transcriptional regulator